MEPVTIALICAASFGAVVALSAFIRQLLLSRDKNLNDEAQRKAINQEAGELEKMREQMQSNKRFDSHYKVLGANKDAIIYLDNKIEDVLRKKAQLVDRYAQVSLKESGAIVEGGISIERKDACDRLKKEIDEEIKFYDSELLHLQQRRTSLWDTHTDLQEYLLGQEKSRNESLDHLYKQHTSLLEKYIFGILMTVKILPNKVLMLELPHSRRLFWHLYNSCCNILIFRQVLILINPNWKMLREMMLIKRKVISMILKIVRMRFIVIRMSILTMSLIVQIMKILKMNQILKMTQD